MMRPCGAAQHHANRLLDAQIRARQDLCAERRPNHQFPFADASNKRVIAALFTRISSRANFSVDAQNPALLWSASATRPFARRGLRRLPW